MKKYSMPSCLSDIGITPSQETIEAYYQKLMLTSAVAEAGEEAPEKLKQALQYLLELK